MDLLNRFDRSHGYLSSWFVARRDAPARCGLEIHGAPVSAACGTVRNPVSARTM